MIKNIFFLVFFIFTYNISYSTDYKSDTLSIDSLISQNDIKLFKEQTLGKKFKHIKINKQKITALILDILCGPVGGHRMALGTKPIVPIFYALTIGGGFFILPAVDFFVILFTKDISKYQNNSKIIMWLN